MNTKLYFENIDLSPMRMGETEDERELRERIENEYGDQAREVGRKFHDALTSAIESVKDDGYYGTVTFDVIKKINRYAYIKNYKNNSDIEIDLLARTFTRLYW